MADTSPADPRVPRTRADLLASLPDPWPRSEVSLSGGPVSVRRAVPLDPPSAQPALFVHGLGGQATNWTDLMAMLRDRLDGVAVDLPGFGWTPPPRDDRWTPQAYAELLVELVEREWGGAPVHLFGNSLGGAVAVQLAARHRELVRTLTLVSPALPDLVPRRTNVPLAALAVPGLGRPIVHRVRARSAERRARATLDLCFADPGAVPARRVAEAVSEVERRDALPYVDAAYTEPLRGLLATFLDRSPERPWRLAGRISAPTLLVHGRRDKLVDPIAAHTKAFQDLRVLLLMRCGHVAQMEAPGLVAEAWRELLPHPAPHRVGAAGPARGGVTDSPTRTV